MLSEHRTYCLSGAARHLSCLIGLKWIDAAKSLLDHVDCIGFAGGYCFAVLVGNCGDHSTRRSELVGGVSQRLVLAGFRKNGDDLIPRNLSRMDITPREIPLPQGRIGMTTGSIISAICLARFAPPTPSS
jgi:hypothetical protein